MPGVTRIAGRAVALDRADVDTDQIIPAAWLKHIGRTGFADGLFGALRADSDFPLNRPGAAQAKVLVAGANFGCGSSREHAVWALQDFGFAAVVSPRFADIFRGNCVSAGLVPVEADEQTVARVFAALSADPDAEVVVDVAARSLAVPSAGIDAGVPAAGLRPLAAARGTRRRRADAPARRRDRRLRGGPSGLAADRYPGRRALSWRLGYSSMTSNVR